MMRLNISKRNDMKNITNIQEMFDKNNHFNKTERNFECCTHCSVASLLVYGYVEYEMDRLLVRVNFFPALSSPKFQRFIDRLKIPSRVLMLHALIHYF